MHGKDHMIIHINQNSSKKETQALLQDLTKENLRLFPVGHAQVQKIVVMGTISETVRKKIEKSDVVDTVTATNGKKYKLTSRMAQDHNTIVPVGDITIGGSGIVIMAGPCSVESRDQITTIAKAVKKSGGHILRGGAYKPRTAPYDFQGLEKAGLKFLQKAAAETGLKIITEVLDPRDVETVAEISDILQVGTRNMQNYALLKELGNTNKPVLLKRGMWASYSEFLLAAEYIVVGGNPNVILCERGIRTHVAELRFTLDLNAVPYLKKESHLPVVVDPSHGTGRADLVLPMARAAIAAGADGLILETHFAPELSISDAEQTISLEDFAQVVNEVGKISAAMGRRMF